ncbi:MAG: DUF4157 domain-containing protein [Methanosarcina sp.]
MAIIQRARINPKSLTHADVMQLQRTIGNRAVGRLLSEIGLIPSKAKQAQTVQRQELVQRQEIPEEEEPLQGKFESGLEKETCPSCMQRQEIPEEEKPLQGKMIGTIQRQEIPEEEEPLQGKFENKPELACPPCFAAPIVQRQEMPEEEEPLQGKFESIQRQEIPEEKEPLQTKRENNTSMPDNLKAGVESLSGIDMSDVRVHYNSDKPAEVGALAYTQGTNIHVAPGQERHLPHEAWHVVQQKQGRVRPIMQMKDGTLVNDDQGLEHEADVMGMKASYEPGSRGVQVSTAHELIHLVPREMEVERVRPGEGGEIQCKKLYEDFKRLHHNQGTDSLVFDTEEENAHATVFPDSHQHSGEEQYDYISQRWVSVFHVTREIPFGRQFFTDTGKMIDTNNNRGNRNGLDNLGSNFHHNKVKNLPHYDDNQARIEDNRLNQDDDKARVEAEKVARGRKDQSQIEIKLIIRRIVKENTLALSSSDIDFDDYWSKFVSAARININILQSDRENRSEILKLIGEEIAEKRAHGKRELLRLREFVLLDPYIQTDQMINAYTRFIAGDSHPEYSVWMQDRFERAYQHYAKQIIKIREERIRKIGELEIKTEKEEDKSEPEEGKEPVNKGPKTK